MAEYFYNHVIIGAGPAGMAAAITLKKKNADVCVLDRAVFPRDKTCAGLVTAKALRLIESLFEGDTKALFCCAPDTLRLFHKTDLLVNTPLSRPVHMVDRRDFDNALVEEYKRRGGTLREGETGLVIDDKNRLITTQNGDTIRYNFLLYADGAKSKAHRSLNIDAHRLAFGLEAYLPAETLNTESVDLFFGYLDSGYAWVFPHGGRVCVGIAEQYNNTKDYRKILDGFLADLGVSDKAVKYTGAFLPYGTVIPQERLPEHVMLVGDAGGFADPLSGEGLYMAMQSGINAANATSSPEPKETYLDSMETIIRTIKDGKKVQKTFYAPMIHKTFLKKVRGKNELVAYFFEEMVDDYCCEYRDIRKLIGSFKKD